MPMDNKLKCSVIKWVYSLTQTFTLNICSIGNDVCHVLLQQADKEGTYSNIAQIIVCYPGALFLSLNI